LLRYNNIALLYKLWLGQLDGPDYKHYNLSLWYYEQRRAEAGLVFFA